MNVEDFGLIIHVLVPIRETCKASFLREVPRSRRASPVVSCDKDTKD